MLRTARTRAPRAHARAALKQNDNNDEDENREERASGVSCGAACESSHRPQWQRLRRRRRLSKAAR